MNTHLKNKGKILYIFETGIHFVTILIIAYIQVAQVNYIV